MPYKVEKDTEACSISEPFAVKKKADGKVVGCHASRESANKQVAALYARESHMDENDSHLFELFFADGDTVEEDGLFWKDILKEGTWSYRPGPGGKSIPVPLKIVGGNSETRDEIGMADLVEAFEDGAIDHVTVPTSHDDKPHENTGYVKKLKIVDRDGEKVLRAGLDFTEPEIKGKAQRGSIANTSSGIVFDYIKKDSGKTYKAVLGHVALTNKPWLNGMKPFGVAASEEYSEQEPVTLLSEDVIWDNSKSMSWLRDNVTKSIQTGEDGDNQAYVLDIMPGRALVAKLSNGGKQSNYVVPFQIRNNELKVANQDRWISASKEWVKASMDNTMSGGAVTSEQITQNSVTSANTGGVVWPSTTTGIPWTPYIDFGPRPESVKDANEPETNEGGNSMGSEVKDEKQETQETPSDNPAPDVAALSEEAREEIAEKIRSEMADKYGGLTDENEALRKQIHEMRVRERVDELKEEGFSEYPSLLTEIQNLMLADKGSKVLTLSETKEDETKEVELSASEVIERLIGALPKKDGKVALSEQALVTEDNNRPPATPDTDDISEDERVEALAKELGLSDFPTREKVTTQGGDK